MRTVKEVSKMTGISVRTLHYYDEIGLLKPSEVSEASYRLYDDTALEKLQQILFFREFDMPLKDIKAIMENPALDRNQILRSQRQMLVLKKERLERLISSIDGILKGENKVDFEVFSKTEMKDLYHSMISNMKEEQKTIFIEQYGSMEAFEKHFLENASSEEAQRNFQKVVEWYGSKDGALEVAKNRENSGIFSAYQNRIDTIFHKLAEKKGSDVNSFEVKQLIGEYDFVSKQMYQMKDVSKMMLEMAKEYQNNTDLQKAQDAVYGAGTTEYIGQAMENFYDRK